MKILVAEDDPISLLALETLLREQGHDVTAVTDGRAACAEMERDSYSVAILDWMMPYLDGIQVCRKIRARQSRKYCCVIMVTAKYERADRVVAIKAGVDVFISKPLDHLDLVARLQIAKRIIDLEERSSSDRNRGLAAVAA